MGDMPASNDIQRHGKIIVITVKGDQTTKTVRTVKEEVAELMDVRFGPKYILIDLRNVGTPDKGAREEGRRFLRELPYRRIAMYGANAWILHIVVNLILKFAADPAKVKMFPDEVSARAWLTARNPINLKRRAQKSL